MQRRFNEVSHGMITSGYIGILVWTGGAGGAEPSSSSVISDSVGMKTLVEDTMLFHTRCLFVVTTILLFLAIGCLHYAFCWSPLLILGLLFAGAVGSCVSVLAKMPLFDVALSAELEAYGRPILARIAMGVCASLIGCALLGWGVLRVSLQNQTFTDALNSSLAAPATSAVAAGGKLGKVFSVGRSPVREARQLHYLRRIS
jgi:hypothetical protein